MLDYSFVEEETDHDDIGLRRLDFNFFYKDKKGVGREGSREFPYLIMLIKIWTGDWKDNLKTMNLKVNEENGKVMVIGNGWYRKSFRFSSNAFCKNIGCLVSDITFGLRISRMWEKGEEIKIRGKKMKIRSIWIKVDLYEVFLSYIIYCLLFYLILY